MSMFKIELVNADDNDDEICFVSIVVKYSIIYLF